MAEDQTYNGWSNYPTWAVNLWLSNDEGLYHQTLELVSSMVRDEWTAHGIANTLKDWVVNDLTPNMPASFAADLLGYALDQVDWPEIANAWIEDSAAVES